MLATPPLPVALSPPQHTSADFLDRLIRHEDDAFAELVRIHGPRLLAVATRYLPCRADAEDAVQEAYVNVVRYIHGFNRASRLETWLHRIVVNCALMSLRTRRRRPVLTNAESETIGSMTSRVRGAPVALPPDPLEREEGRRLFRASLHALPPTQQSALALRYESGMPVRSIANLLDVSTSTVKTRLHRARRSLGFALGAPAM